MTAPVGPADQQGDEHSGGSLADIEDLGDAARSRPFGWLGRVGLLSQGVVYGVAGALSVTVALRATSTERPAGASGDASTAAGPSGALREIARSASGRVLLGLLAAGFVCYAVWKCAEVVGGRRQEGFWARALSGLVAVVYLLLAVQSGRLATGTRAPSSQSEDAQARGASSWLLRMTAGRALLVLVGLIVVGIGVGLVVVAWRQYAVDNWHLGADRPRARLAVSVLGVASWISRGVVFVAAGVFLVAAAVTADPQKAKGLDGTLRSLAEQPYGPWLLLALAAGLVCFAVYSVGEGLFARV